MIILLFNLLGVREHRAVYTVNFTFQIRESIVEKWRFLYRITEHLSHMDF